MTKSNGKDRLDRIEAILEETNRGLAETRRIAESNGKAIQAMLEQRATDRLEHEQRMRREEERIKRYDELLVSIAATQRGLAQMLSSIDEDRPTILRKLNTIENKTDKIENKLDRLLDR